MTEGHRIVVPALNGVLPARYRAECPACKQTKLVLLADYGKPHACLGCQVTWELVLPDGAIVPKAGGTASRKVDLTCPGCGTHERVQAGQMVPICSCGVQLDVVAHVAAPEVAQLLDTRERERKNSDLIGAGVVAGISALVFLFGGISLVSGAIDAARQNTDQTAVITRRAHPADESEAAIRSVQLSLRATMAGAEATRTWDDLLGHLEGNGKRHVQALVRAVKSFDEKTAKDLERARRALQAAQEEVDELERTLHHLLIRNPKLLGPNLYNGKDELTGHFVVVQSTTQDPQEVRFAINGLFKQDGFVAGKNAFGVVIQSPNYVDPPDIPYKVRDGSHRVVEAQEQQAAEARAKLLSSVLDLVGEIVRIYGTKASELALLEIRGPVVEEHQRWVRDLGDWRSLKADFEASGRPQIEKVRAASSQFVDVIRAVGIPDEAHERVNAIDVWITTRLDELKIESARSADALLSAYAERTVALARGECLPALNSELAALDESTSFSQDLTVLQSADEDYVNFADALSAAAFVTGDTLKKKLRDGWETGYADAIRQRLAVRSARVRAALKLPGGSRELVAGLRATREGFLLVTLHKPGAGERITEQRIVALVPEAGVWRLVERAKEPLGSGSSRGADLRLQQLPDARVDLLPFGEESTILQRRWCRQLQILRAGGEPLLAKRDYRTIMLSSDRLVLTRGTGGVRDIECLTPAGDQIVDTSRFSSGGRTFPTVMPGGVAVVDGEAAVFWGGKQSWTQGVGTGTFFAYSNALKDGRSVAVLSDNANGTRCGTIHAGRAYAFFAPWGSRRANFGDRDYTGGVVEMDLRTGASRVFFPVSRDVPPATDNPIAPIAKLRSVSLCVRGETMYLAVVSESLRELITVDLGGGQITLRAPLDFTLAGDLIPVGDVLGLCARKGQTLDFYIMGSDSTDLQRVGRPGSGMLRAAARSSTGHTVVVLVGGSPQKTEAFRFAVDGTLVDRAEIERLPSDIHDVVPLLPPAWCEGASFSTIYGDPLGGSSDLLPSALVPISTTAAAFDLPMAIDGVQKVSEVAVQIENGVIRRVLVPDNGGEFLRATSSDDSPRALREGVVVVGLGAVLAVDVVSEDPSGDPKQPNAPGAAQGGSVNDR